MYDRNEPQWHPLAPDLSEFLHLFWLTNAIPLSPTVAIRGPATPDDLSALRSQMRPIATANWRWPIAILEFYEADGILAHATFEADGTGATITLAANTTPPNPLFASIAGPSWLRPRPPFAHVNTTTEA